MAPAVCAVCSKVKSKYKCPKCLIRYCSLGCFKTHKETCAPASTSTSTDVSSVSGSTSTERTSSIAGSSAQAHAVATGASLAPASGLQTSPIDLGDDEEAKDRVTDEQLNALGHSTALKDMLHNPHLRDVVRGIDSAPNATGALKKAMELPIFAEFADECLRIVAEHGKAKELMYEPPPPDPFASLKLL